MVSTVGAVYDRASFRHHKRTLRLLEKRAVTARAYNSGNSSFAESELDYCVIAGVKDCASDIPSWNFKPRRYAFICDCQALARMILDRSMDVFRSIHWMCPSAVSIANSVCAIS